MRSWLQKNRLLVLLLGAAVLMGYTHQLSGRILSHHHCAEHASDHSNHDHHDHHDHDDHSPCSENDESPSGDDTSCHCDQCHLASVTIDLPDVFTTHAAVAPLTAQPKVPAPESPVPALDVPPIILAA